MGEPFVTNIIRSEGCILRKTLWLESISLKTFENLSVIFFFLNFFYDVSNSINLQKPSLQWIISKKTFNNLHGNLLPFVHTPLSRSVSGTVYHQTPTICMALFCAHFLWVWPYVWIVPIDMSHDDIKTTYWCPALGQAWVVITSLASAAGAQGLPVIYHSPPGWVCHGGGLCGCGPPNDAIFPLKIAGFI